MIMNRSLRELKREKIYNNTFDPWLLESAVWLRSVDKNAAGSNAECVFQFTPMR